MGGGFYQTDYPTFFFGTFSVFLFFLLDSHTHVSPSLFWFGYCCMLYTTLQPFLLLLLFLHPRYLLNFLWTYLEKLKAKKIPTHWNAEWREAKNGSSKKGTKNYGYFSLQSIHVSIQPFPKSSLLNFFLHRIGLQGKFAFSK
jgi:hypothetical protein